VAGVTHLPAAPRPLRYAGALGCAIVILYGSIIEPGDGVPPTLFGIEFTVYLHVIAYAGFTSAIGYAVLSADRRTLLVAAAIAALYGVGVELVQGTLPYRTMSALDMLINAGGATAGAACWWLVAPQFGGNRGDRPTAEA
jgi:hypothetical protein